ELGGNVAAGTALVLDDDLLAPYLRETIGDQPADHVDAARRGERYDEPHHPVGPGLRAHDAGGCCKRRGRTECDDPATPHHGRPPSRAGGIGTRLGRSSLSMREGNARGPDGQRPGSFGPRPPNCVVTSTAVKSVM